MVHKIEKVKLGDDLKPIGKKEVDLMVIQGFFVFITIICLYFAIWTDIIYIDIFCTIMLSLVIMIAMRKGE